MCSLLFPYLSAIQNNGSLCQMFVAFRVYTGVRHTSSLDRTSEEGAQRWVQSGRQSLMKLKRGPMVFVMELSKKSLGDPSSLLAGMPSSLVTNPSFHRIPCSLQHTLQAQSTSVAGWHKSLPAKTVLPVFAQRHRVCKHTKLGLLTGIFS